MLVLVTRPRVQATATVTALQALGHAAIVDPALEIRQLPVPPLTPEGVAAVVLTSANAVPALPTSLYGLPVFAVGEPTARAARALGCTEVRAGEDDGRALAGLIGRTLPASAGTILHLGAAEVQPGLAEVLRAAGYAYRHVPVYRSEPSAGLSAETKAALRTGRLDAALFFSPRTAAVWCRHLRAAGLEDRLGAVLAACLSDAVAAELRDLPWRAVRVAARRDQTALLRCLDDLLGRW